MFRMGIQIKVSVMGMVYRKALRLTQEAKSHHTEGEIVNMMQQDSERMMMFIPSSPQLVSGLIQYAQQSALFSLGFLPKSQRSCCAGSPSTSRCSSTTWASRCFRASSFSSRWSRSTACSCGCR